MCSQLKNGNVRDGVNVAAQLLAPQRPEAAQHFGYAIMQHLVRITGISDAAHALSAGR